MSTTLFIALGMLTCMILVFETAFYQNRRRAKKDPGWKPDGLGAIEGSTLGLFALLLGFTFAAALSRHDDRRKILVEEANDISTAVLRADLYDDTNRLAFRKDFREYVETRIQYFEAGDDESSIRKALDSTRIVSAKLWERAALMAKDPRYLVQTNQMVPALNAMIDVVSTRDAAMHARLGYVMIGILFIILLFASFMAGFSSKQETLYRMGFIGFAFVGLVVLFFIIDLDRPYAGLITLKNAEARILELRAMFD